MAGINLMKDAEVIHYMFNRSDKEENFPSNIAKRLDITYSHIVKLMIRFEKDGLITTEKLGRTRRTFLTKKGKEIAAHITAIKKLNNS
jgi:DNA-binding MarR family transcriptional regulator